MIVDAIAYQISRLLRNIKVKIARTDQTKLWRTAIALMIFLAVFSVSPGKVARIEEPKEGEIQGAQEDSGESQQFNHETMQPLRLPDSPPIASVSAQAAYFIDNQTDTVLYEKNADQRLPMASLTKIMTAVVVLDNFQLDEMVTVPEVCTNLPPPKVGYAAGQTLTVEELLYGMLVASASDASCALSHHQERFLDLMNQKAEALGLTQTHFENEVGLDGENGNHLSTAKDLVKLSEEALKNGVFRKIVGTAEWRGLTSTNELLFSLPGTTGIKTGYTEQAKGCLAVSYERNGREIIGVILGSDDRFSEAQDILNWIFRVYQWP
jgi:D-alanyl-D-alanine carboxypeptidase